MKLTHILPSLLLAATPALTQQTTTYTDTKSNITFQLFNDPKTGYFFGAALPQTPGTDFIGIIGGKGTGWSGVSLGGSMVGKLLIAAWPNGNAVVSSFRKASSYSPPAETTGTFTMTPIPSGTYINSTSWTFTFLCSKCLDSAGSTTFAPSDTTPVLGWAASASAPSKKADHASPIGKHSSQGNYAIDLVKARSASFAGWAGLAGPKGVRREFSA